MSVQYQCLQCNRWTDEIERICLLYDDDYDYGGTCFIEKRYCSACYELIYEKILDTIQPERSKREDIQCKCTKRYGCYCESYCNWCRHE